MFWKYEFVLAQHASGAEYDQKHCQEQSEKRDQTLCRLLMLKAVVASNACSAIKRSPLLVAG